MHSEESEWFPFSEDLWREPKTLRPRLRLLADVHIPIGLISVLRSARVDVKTARELKCDRLSDLDLFEKAKRLRRVILTLDAGFWAERKYPLRRGGGIIVIDTGENSLAALAMAFGFFYAVFGRSFGGVWDDGGRVRAFSNRFLLRVRSIDGRAMTYDVRVIRGMLSAREISHR